MALGAFVTDAKSTTCRRRFSIQRTVLLMRGLLRLKSSSRSTHVLMKTGCLFGVSSSPARVLVLPEARILPPIVFG